MTSPKIIVVGSVAGHLRLAFEKLATLHAKNQFSFALITGDVFTEDDDESTMALLNGGIRVPLPTYFTVGTRPLPPSIESKVRGETHDVCDNLHFLGKRGVMKTLDGVRIVTLGGLLGSKGVTSESTEQHHPYFTTSDALTLRGAQSADILLTTMWPQNVWKGTQQPFTRENITTSASPEIADICAALKPRYHLACSPGDFYYERAPFVQLADNENNPKITRFISMAPFGNAAKEKSMYAFTLPQLNTKIDIPPGTTSSPFSQLPSSRHGRRPHEESFNRFATHHESDSNRHKKRRRMSPPPGPDRCYFCLSNPAVSTHMICSIGDDSYITTAKGPLPAPDTFMKEGLQFPGHFLLIPFAHETAISLIGDVSDPQSASASTYREMERFRESLQAMFASVSRNLLGAVTWEICRARGVHVHWQVMASPRSLIEKGLVETAFRVEAENLEYPPFTEMDLSLDKQADFGDFFRVWIWADDGEDKITGKQLVMRLEPDSHFDLQLGRRVMSKLLDLQSRERWQDCTQSVEEETADVENFRKVFKDWDFTLTE